MSDVLSRHQQRDRHAPVWSLLKRTIKGTHVHVAPFHLFRYLDSQTFVFNQRAHNDLGRFVEAMRTVKGSKLTGKLKIKSDPSSKERGLEAGSWPC